MEQWQQASEQQQLFQYMADEQKAMLDQLISSEAQACKQLWEQVV